jgi:hypothetical protein
MADTAGHNLTLDPMGNMFENASSLKSPGQLKANCIGMIIGRSSTKFLSDFREEAFSNMFPIGSNVKLCPAVSAILNFISEQKTSNL